jgi:hypothetical protein
MVGSDGKTYPVPANYASKSKLVQGDILKLTIADDGAFMYKQIGPIPRKQVVGVLNQKDGHYFVDVDGKQYRVLLASVTYFKAKPGDQVSVNVPADETVEAEWAALEAHAASCTACAEELRAWKSLSVAAQELRDYTDAPPLWPRIHRALVEQAARADRRKPLWNWRSWFPNFSPSWQTAAAAATVLLVMTSVGWYLRPHNPAPKDSASLLKTQALANVERAQSAYVQAIDKLAADAKPKLENPDRPLLANYREKLLVLDSAIDDLRAQTGQNPSNAHLRYELLAMYQEKQRTLEEILEEKR